MRGGKFLAEESPENLLMQYQCETLEEVFLKLAIMQNKGKRRRSSIAQEISDQITVPMAMTVSFCFVIQNAVYFYFKGLATMLRYISTDKQNVFNAPLELFHLSTSNNSSCITHEVDHWFYPA